MLEKVPPSDVTQNYSSWLILWKELIQPNPCTVKVPPIACTITTPLRQNAWCHMLTTYPDRNLVEFFIEGITSGFRISFNYTMTTLRPAQWNLESTKAHPSVVTEYLKAELHHIRISGPFGAHTYDHRWSYKQIWSHTKAPPK